MSNILFNHLHVHSSYSFVDSLATVGQLFDRVKELGQKALAITDHGSMANIFDAHKISTKTGIKFIPGMEAYFVSNVKLETKEKRKHLILLAKNEIGYRNLLSLNYEGFKNYQFVPFLGKVFPVIDWSMLEKYKDGLICTTACTSGVIAKCLFSEEDSPENKDSIIKAVDSIKHFKEIFKDDFYFEIQPHSLKVFAIDRKTGEFKLKDGNKIIVIDQDRFNRFLIAASKKFNVKLVGACDVHYINKEDSKYQDALLAVSEKKPINDKDRHKYDVSEFYLKTGNEVFEYFKKEYGDEVAIEACNSTLEIVDKCEDSKYLAPSGVRFPKFNVKEEKDYSNFLKYDEQNKTTSNVPEDHRYMRYKVISAFQKQFKGLDKETRNIYVKRISKEINVLEQHNFCSYMLIVSDFIKKARENGVRIGPGRGSVCGSLVAYLLEIHDVNPIEYDLLFERFHNKEKKAFPDIDTDIDPVGRDWVKHYITNKYGNECVAHVSNLSRMTPKVTIKDIARSLELGGSKSEAFKIANKMTDTIPDDAHTIEEAFKSSREFSEYCNKYPELKEISCKLVGLEKTYSSHAAGIVIGDADLSTIVPLRIDKNNAVSVQYEKNRCEEMGLIKMDLLGLEHLRVINNTIENAKKIGLNCPEPKDMPLDDKSVWNDVARGFTMGVFQMSSPHMMELCKQIKPKSVEDLSLVNALGRPSAIKSRDTYIARRDGKLKVDLKFECLRPALQETLGVGVYEEQLMKLANTVAGWDLNKADGLRKLTKYKNKEPQFAEKLKQDFINDASIESKISKEAAEEIWTETIEPFAGYGFNKCVSGFEKVDIFNDNGVFIKQIALKDLYKSNECGFVKSRDENTKQCNFVPIKNVYCNGEKEMFEFTFDNCKKVKCTMDHKFRVSDGRMLPIKQILEEGLDVVCM